MKQILAVLAPATLYGCAVDGAFASASLRRLVNGLRSNSDSIYLMHLYTGIVRRLVHTRRTFLDFHLLPRHRPLGKGGGCFGLRHRRRAAAETDARPETAAHLSAAAHRHVGPDRDGGGGRAAVQWGAI